MMEMNPVVKQLVLSGKGLSLYGTLLEMFCNDLVKSLFLYSDLTVLGLNSSG